MLTELQLQSKLVEAVKRIGGFGYKQSNKFLAGPPDLYLSHPATGPVFIEVKLNQPGHNVVLVSPLQESTIIRMQNAGSRCGVLVLMPLTDIIGGYDLFFTSDPSLKRLDKGAWSEFHKGRGEEWPILDVMRLASTGLENKKQGGAFDMFPADEEYDWD